MNEYIKLNVTLPVDSSFGATEGSVFKIDKYIKKTERTSARYFFIGINGKSVAAFSKEVDLVDEPKPPSVIPDDNVDIIIYGKDNCPHCVTAEKLCIKNGLSYKYYKLGTHYDADKVNELVASTKQRTFPYVFSDVFIGGAKELHTLIKNRK